MFGILLFLCYFSTFRKDLILGDFNVKICVKMRAQVSVILKSEVRVSKASFGEVKVLRGGSKKNVIYFVSSNGHLYDYFLQGREGWEGVHVPLVPLPDPPLCTSQ